MHAKNDPSELHITRLFNAPLATAWRAWTDLEQLSQWWGPRGFSITTKSKELKPGGDWIYTMHGPDGTDYPNHAHYFEVVEQSRLVYDHGIDAKGVPLFRVTVNFAAQGRKTKMDMTMRFASPEAAIEIGKHIKAANGTSTWDRLAEFVDHKESGQDRFFINRSFRAPIQDVFAMWTDPQHVSRWLPQLGPR